MYNVLRYIGQSLLDFLISIPINTIIIMIICIIAKLLLGFTLKDCLKTTIAYLLICFILSFFGLHMPSIITVFNWCKAFILQFF